MNSQLRFFALALFLIVLAACTASPEPIPVTTALHPTNTLPPAAAGTATPTIPTPSTATATSTPAPTPTATPRPEVRLGYAVQAAHDGDFDTAIALYQSVVAGPATDTQIEQARIELANVQRLARHLPEAIDQYTQFLQAFPQSKRLSEAWFGLAEAYFAQASWSKSIAAYQKYLGLRGDLIAAYAQERSGDAYTQLNDLPHAVTAYQAAMTAATSNTDIAGLREKLALTYRLMKNLNDALAQYDAILSFAQQPAYRAQVMYQAGQAQIDSGQTDAGYKRFIELVNTYPDRNDAYQALVALVDAGVEVNDFQRGLVDYYAAQYEAAIAAFKRFIAATTDHGNAYYYIGLSYRGEGNIPAALKAFDEIINQHPEASRWGDAWIEKAKTQVTGGDTEGALATLQTFVKKYPTAPQAPTALWNAAGFLEGSGDYPRAIDLNLQLQAGYPNDDNAPEALFDAGLDAYRVNSYTVAISSWQTLSNTYPLSQLYPAALLWQGKALKVTNQPANATQVLQLALQDSRSYYGLRAADVLSGTPGLPQVQARLDIDPDAGRVEAEKWLANWLSVPVTTLLTLPAGVTSDPRFQRGVEFWQLRQTARAIDEFESVRAAHAGDAAVLYPLAIYFRDMGLYRSSILYAGEIIRLSPAGTADQAPIFLARLQYPIYYANLVLPEATARQIDPLVIFSLIRQESLFEGVATSSAYANGLMQIVPATGGEIANRLHWPDYQLSDLYRPMISVKFGVYYLALQRDGFDGDLIAAWAAYNGGPGNAAHWQQIAQGDVDLFVESISLAETRLYIERLRENLGMYQRLYR